MAIFKLKEPYTDDLNALVKDESLHENINQEDDYDVSNVAYTIGYLDGSDIGYIGWNSDIDYYDVIFTDGLAEIEDRCFTEINGDGEEVHIYRFDTPEEAEEERLYAQKEFDENIIIIKVIKEGNFWYPLDKSLHEDIKESNKRLYLQYINKIKKATTKDELITLKRRAYSEKEFSKYDLEEISRAVDERTVKILNQLKFTESKKRKRIKEAKEGKSDKSDLETLLTAVKETLDYFDYHNKNLTKKQDYVLDDLKDIYQEIKRGR